MINETVITQDVNCGHYNKRICWSAIFLGALVAIGLSFLLNLFCLAIGISAFSFNTNASAGAVAIGSLLALLVGVIVSMLAAGYTAGYFAHFHCYKRNLGIVYGFCTWSVALILAALLASPMGTYMANYTNDPNTPSVNVSNQNTAAKTNTPVAVETTQVSPNTTKTANIQTTPETLAWSVFSIFILFAVGALASCLGGIWGMQCRRDDDEVVRTTTV